MQILIYGAIVPWCFRAARRVTCALNVGLSRGANSSSVVFASTTYSVVEKVIGVGSSSKSIISCIAVMKISSFVSND